GECRLPRQPRTQIASAARRNSWRQTGLLSGVVLDWGARDLEFARCGLIAHGVARLAPSGDDVKYDLYRGRSHLREVHVASRLLLYSFPLGLQKILYLLQLTDQLFEFCNRCGSNALNKSRNIRVSSGLGLRRRLHVREIAAFVSRFHALLPPLDPSAQLHEKKDTQRLYPTRRDFHRLSWTFAGCRDSGRSSPLFTHSGRVSHERCLRDASLSKIEAVTSDGAGLMRRRRRRGARCSSASIAANSFSMARADGAPSVSLRWIVSARSSRTRS